MSAGNVTPWGSSAAGEEVWVASGVEVEDAELPTFSVATRVRVGVTVVLFLRLEGTWPCCDATWNITVQWLAGDIACWTLMFLKLVAMYAAAFLPVVIGLNRQAAVLHLFGPRSAVRKLLGVAWGLSLLLALPQSHLLQIIAGKLQSMEFPLWEDIKKTVTRKLKKKQKKQ